MVIATIMYNTQWFSHYMYVYLIDAAIACLLRKPVVLHGLTLSIEEIDLNQVYRPFLIVRGLPPFMSQQTEYLKSHFETLSNAQIQSVEFKGAEALVHFADPRGMLYSAYNYSYII